VTSTLSLPARMAQGGTLFLCRFLNRLWDSHKAWAAYRRSLVALRELDDRLLADVGLNRMDQRRGHPEDYY
jgi:uncharacterized protein YjiS (DUF1127 family)